MIEFNPNYATGREYYSLYLAALGRHEEAIAEARRSRELDRRSQTEYISPFDQALAYVGLGQKDKAFELLNRTVDERDFSITLLNEWWIFDPLRSDPRFAALLKKTGLEE